VSHHSLIGQYGVNGLDDVIHVMQTYRWRGASADLANTSRPVYSHVVTHRTVLHQTLETKLRDAEQRGRSDLPLTIDDARLILHQLDRRRHNPWFLLALFVSVGAWLVIFWAAGVL
jgi:hypothetical protein